MPELSEKEIREIKQELENIKSVAMIKWPFFASLMRRCRIIISTGVETAGVNARNEMFVNPEFLKSLNDKAKVFVYGHETEHIAFDDPQREGERIHWIYNWAADSVNNYLLFAHGFSDVKLPIDLVTPAVVAKITGKEEKEVAKMSRETLYFLLEKHLKDKKPPFNIMNDLLEKKGAGGSSSGPPSQKTDSQGNQNKKQNKGTVIQEGDPDAYKDGMTPEEREKYWKEALAKAAMHAKLAGRLPREAELIINGLLQAKVDWKSVIKKIILNGFGKNTISSWKKTSRKHPLLPGTKQLTKPNLHLLVDTSMSTYPLLPQFLGEVYGIVKNQGKGIIYPWDAMAYEPIELKKAIDLGQAIKEKKIKGGGGTVIAPVLEAVLKSMKYGDITVVITDGAIFDLTDKTTQELLQKVAQKSGQAVFGSIDWGITIPAKWKKVKIEP